MGNAKETTKMTTSEIKAYQSAVKSGRAFAQVGAKQYRILKVNPSRVVLQAEHGTGGFSVEPNMIAAVVLNSEALNLLD